MGWEKRHRELAVSADARDSLAVSAKCWECRHLRVRLQGRMQQPNPQDHRHRRDDRGTARALSRRSADGGDPQHQGEKMTASTMEPTTTSAHSAMESGQNPQQTFFRVTDNIPEEAWYWAALGSIGLSALLKLIDRDHWALFVGQWPPTFIALALYHRLVRPSAK
jgi:hypothetical protein